MRDAQPQKSPDDLARPGLAADVTLLYGAAGCLVLAQILGVYGLRTKKADLVFAIVMVVLLTAGIAMGISGALHKI